MAKIGYGYGSECHLLRWMGRHRKLFDEKVADAVSRPGESIEWLDFKFDSKKLWPDAELKGLEFLYDQPGLESKWKAFWPTSRGIHNWDAVGWLGIKPNRELLLLEAKANFEEMRSDCKAESPKSILKIETAFERVKQSLNAEPSADWTKDYYQAANRIATLYFLQQEGIPAQLLFVHFLGDRNAGRECPDTEEKWRPALEAQRMHLGLGSDHHLADRIHELFLPVAYGSAERAI